MQVLPNGRAETSANNCAPGSHLHERAGGVDSGHMSDAPAPQASLLIVDDDLRLRDLLERYLAQPRASRCAARRTRQRCAANWRAHHVDLIVLDLMLPDADGLELCRRLRAEGDAKRR